jgi:hypothetical protein
LWGKHDRAIRGDEPTWTISCERKVSIVMVERRIVSQVPAAAFWKPFWRKLRDEAVECLCRDETTVQQTATHITRWNAHDALADDSVPNAATLVRSVSNTSSSNEVSSLMQHHISSVKYQGDYQTGFATCPCLFQLSHPRVPALSRTVQGLGLVTNQ